MDMESQTLNDLFASTGIAREQWQQAMNSNTRIAQLDTPQGTFWLKKSAPPRGEFRYHALNFFSWIMRLSLLKAVPQPGGKAAIAMEINRIEQLTQSGALVPEVISSSDDWLLIRHAGDSIVNTLKSADTIQCQRQYLFKRILVALRRIHHNQQYLSQAFIRNILLDQQQDRIVFIDFEDDPLAVMSLADAQARDLLLLINSTARFFINDQAFFHRCIQGFLSDHDPQVIETLRIASQRLQWVTRIPFQRLFGHDYQKLKTGILALNGL